MTLTPDLVRRLPKAELHVHLDAGLRPTTMIELAREAGIALPAWEPAALSRYMKVEQGRSLEEYLQRFELTVPLLQTAEAIERVAYEMVVDAAADNVRYLEVRYCPLLSCAKGLSLDAAIAAELRGLARGERETGVIARAINCSLRHFDPADSVRIAERSVAFRDQGVVAFDLAGPEAGHPPAVHQAAFDVAVDGNLGITIHAGEAAGAASIAEAVHRCRAHRIGHGTRLYEDPQLQRYLRDRRIAIECNITSNLQTGAVAHASAHPVRAYFEAGLAVTLSTDGWLMTGSTLSDEYWLAHTALGFDRAEIETLIMHGFAAAFLPWPERVALTERVRHELRTIV